MYLLLLQWINIKYNIAYEAIMQQAYDFLNWYKEGGNLHRIYTLSVHKCDNEIILY